MTNRVLNVKKLGWIVVYDLTTLRELGELRKVGIMGPLDGVELEEEEFGDGDKKTTFLTFRMTDDMVLSSKESGSMAGRKVGKAARDYHHDRPQDIGNQNLGAWVQKV